MLSTCSYASMLYVWPYFYVIGLCYYPFVADEETEAETKDKLLGVPGRCLQMETYNQASSETSQQRAWYLQDVFPALASFCSFPEKKAKQNKMRWYHFFFFFKEKQVPKTALRSIQIFIPIFSPPRSTGSEMKIDTQAGDPKAGSSTRKQCPSQTCGSLPSRSRKQIDTHDGDLPTRIESKRHLF